MVDFGHFLGLFGSGGPVFFDITFQNLMFLNNKKTFDHIKSNLVIFWVYFWHFLGFYGSDGPFLPILQITPLFPCFKLRKRPLILKNQIFVIFLSILVIFWDYLGEFFAFFAYYISNSHVFKQKTNL